MNLFGKTGLTIAAILFAAWIILPWLLMAFFHLINTSGGNIGLLIGFLKMVSVIGLVFAAAYAVAAFFGKPWLIAAPILFLIVTSVVDCLRPPPPLQITKFQDDSIEPATALANQHAVELTELLPFASATMSPASAAAIVKIAQNRQLQLASHIEFDRGFGNQALYAASLLTNASPDVVKAVQAEGKAFAKRLRRFNELNQPADCQTLGHVYRDHFQAWRTACLALHRNAGFDGRAPLLEILELAQVRSQECAAINDLRAAAQTALEQLSTSPK